MKIAAVWAALMIVFTACGDSAPDATSTPRSVRRSSCDSAFPFEVTFLPQALRGAEVRSGPGGDATPNPEAIEFHYEADGAEIDVRRGVAYYPGQDPSPITVAGVAGQLGEIDGGFSVNFQTGPDRCDRYEITTSGVSGEDVVRFADGLRVR